MKALTSGVNLIDTSSNFSGGDGEIMTGKVIKHLVRENKLSRDVCKVALMFHEFTIL
jgi:aryl-alcohol dehydrogenase-like predicted oxidoreductase